MAQLEWVTESVGEIPPSEGLRQGLWEALIYAQLEARYTPERRRQQKIIARLPEDLVGKLAAHLLSALEEQVWFAQRLRLPLSFDEGMVLRGKLFELLIEADPELARPTALTREILDLAHNPSSFGLDDKLGLYRNPDLAFVIMREGDSLMVEGVGEAKLGLLNERAFKQLSASGFRRGMGALIACVNGLSDPSKYGLVELGKHRQRLKDGGTLITLDPAFRQVLIVPANRDTSDAAALIKRSDFDEEEDFKEFAELLSDPTKVEVKTAAFSAGEVAAMAKYLQTLLDFPASEG